jgi:hypothetical protein
MAHGFDRCEVSVMVPFDPTEPWSGSIIGSKDCLAATAVLPITLLLIRNQENPIWQQHIEAVSTLKGPHFHNEMTSLARYAQYLFNLQHYTTRTGMQQPLPPPARLRG